MKFLKNCTLFCIVFILNFYCGPFIWAGSLDSLYSELRKVKTDTSKIRLHNAISYELTNFDNNKGLIHARLAISLSKRINFKIGLAEAYNNLAINYFYLNSYDSSLVNFELALNAYKEINNKQGVSKSLKFIASYYYLKGNYDKALDYYFQSLKIIEELSELGESAILTRDIGVAYWKKSDYQKAIEYYNKALDIFSQIKSKIEVASTFNNLGIVYEEQGNYNQALEYHFKSLKIKDEMNDTLGMAASFVNIGNIYNTQGNFKQALDYHLKALAIYEKIGESRDISLSLSNVGLCYEKIGEYDKALEYYFKCLEIQEKDEDKDGMAQTFFNIGDFIRKIKKSDEALEYYLKSLKIREEIGYKLGISQCYESIGRFYNMKGMYQTAKEKLLKGYFIAKEIGSKEEVKEIAFVLSESYAKLNDFKNAYQFHVLHKSLGDSLSNEENTKKVTQLAMQYEFDKKQKLQELEQQKKDELQEAKLKRQKLITGFFIVGFLLMLALAFVIFRSYKTKQRDNRLLAAQKAEIEFQAQQLEITNKELEKLSLVASKTDNAVIIMDADGNFDWVNEGFHRLFGYSLEELKEINQNIIGETTPDNIKELISKCIKFKETVSYEIPSKTPKGEIIWVQSTLTPISDSDGNLIKLIAIDSDITKIKLAEKRIAEQNQNIKNSIHYASRIQTAVMPPKEFLEEVLGEHFVLYKPKDIVSGDFYWLTHKENKTILVVADCTGHGVPGAFMSMLGISFLNEIVNKNKLTQANEILNDLREHVKKSLRQTGKEGEAKDGMDIALCVIDKDNDEIQFSGAFNPMYIVRRTENIKSDVESLKSLADDDVIVDEEFIYEGCELVQINSDKMPIGIHMKEKDSFTNHIIKVHKGDSLYLLSDGYVDQFGGDHGRKFMAKRFKNLLVKINSQPMKEQKNLLNSTIEQWKAFTDINGNIYEQVDDILVIGVRI